MDRDDGPLKMETVLQSTLANLSLVICRASVLCTSGQVDNWVYEDANDVYMKDPEMQKRLMESNPNSFRKMVANFLEANGRGYWETSEENIERLRNLYMEVEDRIEGVEN